jgi:hypothetical protein
MIWMTKSSLDFTKQPKWFRIANITNGTTRTMSISKDGNYLWVGTVKGGLYRVANIMQAYDSLAADISSQYCVIKTTEIKSLLSANRCVTSIAIDPRNNNHILVTLGNYGNATYIYESTNALDSMPAFTIKQGDLPKMPVYSAIIEMNNSKRAYIGTEYGVFYTNELDVAKPRWYEANSGRLGRYPTHMIKQQIYKYDGDYVADDNHQYYYLSRRPDLGTVNYGAIYAGTHGRGFFRTDEHTGIIDNKPTVKLVEKPSFIIYPNPVSDLMNIKYTLPKSSEAIIRVFDMNGRTVKLSKISNQLQGLNKTSILVDDLPKGTYIVNLVSGKESVNSKVIIFR